MELTWNSTVAAMASTLEISMAALRSPPTRTPAARKDLQWPSVGTLSGRELRYRRLAFQGKSFFGVWFGGDSFMLTI
jgi:hypothetical protein